MEVIHCTKCKSDIKIPFLTKQEKKELTVLYQNEKQLAIIDMLKQITKLNLQDSKSLLLHFNKIGCCNRCNYTELKGENVICTKCKAFNLNWG